MRRGHALMVVMFSMVVVTASLSVFLTRFGMLDASRRSEQRRLQAQVLARTACVAGLTGKSAVTTRAGRAQVSRAGASAEVQLGEVSVRLDCASGALRYEARE